MQSRVPIDPLLPGRPVGLERQTPGQQLKQYDRQRINIGRTGNLAGISRLLRGHVLRSTDDPACQRDARLHGRCTGVRIFWPGHVQYGRLHQTEVGNQHPVGPHEQQVARLNVPVNVSLRLGECQAPAGLDDRVQGLGGRGPRPIPQAALETAPITVVH